MANGDTIAGGGDVAGWIFRGVYDDYAGGRPGRGGVDVPAEQWSRFCYFGGWGVALGL